ncbi:hypothetical protein [Neobacillus sp. PS3-40]|uniref:hypothetical protein n=1 Tax=Neobacillus sp. PS3-40 TaxID=3070679 RepID=UPI0027E12238|nr:hypothetical protein [Neobacillus sp. PS3-40]WML44412.1 hypothetical protein RCG20_00390 [Neobacillus sp. PS3-40]
MERPIQIAKPELYDFLKKELDKLHIHSYDYRANVIEQDGGLEMILRFGEGHNQTESHFFTNEMIEKRDEELLEFIQTVGKSCEKSLIAEYFKMMKP